MVWRSSRDDIQFMHYLFVNMFGGQIMLLNDCLLVGGSGGGAILSHRTWPLF